MDVVDVILNLVPTKKVIVVNPLVVPLVVRVISTLIVVVIPVLNDLNFSIPFLNKVIPLFQDKGVTVINTVDLVKDIPVNQRIVNNNDAHASELVHKLIAVSLFEKIIESDQ